MLRRLLLVCLAATTLCLTGCDVQQNIGVRGDVAGANPAQAPQISGPEVTAAPGHPAFDLSAQHGKIVVIDFWGSWCGPCRQEQPDINAMVTRYSGQPVVFVGVAMRDSTDAVRAYQSGMHVSYPTVMDSDESIAGNYNIASPPTIVIVDQQGHVKQRYLGTTVGAADEIDLLLTGK